MDPNGNPELSDFGTLPADLLRQRKRDLGMREERTVKLVCLFGALCRCPLTQ